MDPGSKRALLVALVIAAIGFTACVVKTAPVHRRHHTIESHEKDEKKKHKKQKQKKQKKHKRH